MSEAQTTLSSGLNEPSTSADSASIVNFWLVMRVLRRWWWLIGLVTLLFTSIATIIIFRMTPIYKVSSVLEVKQEERNLIDVSAVENIVVDKEFLTTQIELLQSGRLIRDTIESSNLFADAYMAPLDNEEWVALPRSERMQTLESRFKKNLRVAAIGRSRLIEVSFEHSDPDMAASITNELIENYLANNLSRKFNSTAFAREFLAERLETVRTSLEKSERDLVDYATQNGIIIVDGDDTQNSSGSLDKTALKILNESLTNASVARVEAEVVYQQSLENDFTAEILNNNALAELQDKRLQLQSEYQEKRAKYKPAYPDMIELQSRIDLFDQSISQQKDAIISSSSAKLKNIYDLAVAKEQDLVQRVSALKNSVVDVREKSIDYTILKRQVETERAQYEALLQRLKEISVSDDLGASLVEVVDEATPSMYPYKPNKLSSLLLALAFSSLMGFGCAYTVEIIDDHVKYPEDVKLKLKEIIMGVIPYSKQTDDLLTELNNPQSAISEGYASLRTNLQFSGTNGGPRIIQFTSTRSGEGKSVSSIGTALRIAGIGHRVLLIDADMRRPTFMPTGESIGLSGVLTQDVKFEDEIHKTEYKGLDLLSSGTIVPNPSELLASVRFDELLEWAAEKYDYVIVDSPPVLGLADAPIIGAKVKATLLVVDSGALRTPMIKASIERLNNSGTKLLGVVLTKYRAQAKGYMNYYKYTYGADATNYGKKAKKTKVGNRNFEL